MIAITKISDLEKVENEAIKEKIKDLLDYFLKEYNDFCADGDISPIGAITFIEKPEDFNELSKFGVTVPITLKMFEWIQPFLDDFLSACIVLDNDRAINIIFNKSFLGEIKESNDEQGTN